MQETSQLTKWEGLQLNNKQERLICLKLMLNFFLCVIENLWHKTDGRILWELNLYDIVHL